MKRADDIPRERIRAVDTASREKIFEVVILAFSLSVRGRSKVSQNSFQGSINASPKCRC